MNTTFYDFEPVQKLLKYCGDFDDLRHSGYLSSLKSDFNRLQEFSVSEERIIQIYDAIAELAKQKNGKVFCYLASSALELDVKNCLPSSGDKLSEILKYLDLFDEPYGARLIEAAYSISQNGTFTEIQIINFLKTCYDNLPQSTEGDVSSFYYSIITVCEDLAKKDISLLDPRYNSILENLLMLANTDSCYPRPDLNKGRIEYMCLWTDLFTQIILFSLSSIDNSFVEVDESNLELAFFVSLVSIENANVPDYEFRESVLTIQNLFMSLNSESKYEFLGLIESIMFEAESLESVEKLFKDRIIRDMQEYLPDFDEKDFTQHLLIPSIANFYLICRKVGTKIDISRLTSDDDLLALMLEEFKSHIIKCYDPKLLPSDVSKYLCAISKFDISKFMGQDTVTFRDIIEFALGKPEVEKLLEAKRQDTTLLQFSPIYSSDIPTHNDTDSDSNEFQSCLSTSISLK